MRIGTHTIAELPGKMTLIRPDRITASTATYEGEAFFSWGMTIIGKIISASWNAMSTTQFEAIDTIYAADEQVEFDATDIDGVSSVYNVEIISFDGEYELGVPEIRVNCVMNLKIMSEVTRWP